MIKIGVWSLLLLLASAHGLVVAGLIVRAPRNRAANRCLALLLVAVVLLMTPYTIGYAGFYDAYPWLSFAPLRWTLAFGPLMYGYVRYLGAEQAAPGWWRHFVPAFAQGAYYTAVFMLPTVAKSDWDDAIHAPTGITTPSARPFSACRATTNTKRSILSCRWCFRDSRTQRRTRYACATHAASVA